MLTTVCWIDKEWEKESGRVGESVWKSGKEGARGVGKEEVGKVKRLMGLAG
ncbi:hypothetical protein [Proteiniphilum sp. X52]|uniref:hypothetical protein n=1 Tax=Proteiniphilum sp. X52 TaxID=2382159 RepID=UPI001C8821A1|nr:hypothetical protein [Proteiniphilum sp. X52]